MTWIKVSDDALAAPELIALPRGTRLLHLEAMAYALAHRTGGLIPADALRRLTDEPDPETAAARLVEAGLWTTTGLWTDGASSSWRVLWLMDDQPSAEEQETHRRLNRDRQERWRRHRAGDHSRCDPDRCNALVTRYPRALVTPPRPDPSRPDPSRPDPTGSGEGRGVGKGQGTTGSIDPKGKTAGAVGDETNRSPRGPAILSETERANAIATNRLLVDDPATHPDIRRAALASLRRLGVGESVDD